MRATKALPTVDWATVRSSEKTQTPGTGAPGGGVAATEPAPVGAGAAAGAAAAAKALLAATESAAKAAVAEKRRMAFMRPSSPVDLELGGGGEAEAFGTIVRLFA